MIPDEPGGLFFLALRCARCGALIEIARYQPAAAPSPAAALSPVDACSIDARRDPAPRDPLFENCEHREHDAVFPTVPAQGTVAAILWMLSLPDLEEQQGVVLKQRTDPKTGAVLVDAQSASKAHPIPEKVSAIPTAERRAVVAWCRAWLSARRSIDPKIRRALDAARVAWRTT